MKPMKRKTTQSTPTQSGFKLGNKSESQLVNIDPRLIKVVRRAITITEQDFGVHDGARTAQEQNALFKKGASKMDGYNKKSNHQITPSGFGNAVDLVPYVDGNYVWEPWDLFFPIASAMSKSAKKLGVRIKWGGNWYEVMNDYGDSIADVKNAVERYKKDHPGPDFIDGPHFELV
jgi:peptidoglycan LD-endopeptidase CwlK